MSGMKPKPKCQYCGRKCHPKGLKSHEKWCKARNVDEAEVDIPEPNGSISNPERVERILNGVWKGLSIEDKLDAIHGLYFDPSNPGDE